MARRAGPIRRVIWAVDAFERDNAVKRNLFALLKELKGRITAEIEPVCVVSAAELSLSAELGPGWLDQYEQAARERLTSELKAEGLSGLGPPRILSQGAVSVSKSVETLVAYAKRRRADLIVAGTHGRGGVKRLVLGSFAETLILKSPIPLLVVGPERASVRKLFSQVLFPTDLGPHFRRSLRYVLGLCSQFQSRLTLMNVVLGPPEPLIQDGMFLFGGSWVPVAQYYKQDLDIRRKRLVAAVKTAASRGVRAEYVLRDRGDSISGEITEYAERVGASLIIMAAQSGVVSATLVGSVTRQVVRHSSVPVWIITS
jgi:nucleotide-binding universal stress UspA family protein